MNDKLAAAMVHVFTASGVLCAFLALNAAMAGEVAVMFAWLGLALLIDGLDGPLARLVEVKRHLPRFSGERLDLIIDYLTYVFIPAALLYHGGLLPASLAGPAAGLLLLTSLYHFADEQSKSADNYFIGFPGLWNFALFYVYAFALSPAAIMAVIATGVVLTFVPLTWLHPLRVVRLRPLTIMVGLAWSAAAIAMLLNDFNGDWLLRAILLAGLLYGLAISFFRSLHAPP